MVGQVRVEGWDVGDRAGEVDGQRTVQRAGIVRYIAKSCGKSREKWE